MLVCEGDTVTAAVVEGDGVMETDDVMEGEMHGRATTDKIVAAPDPPVVVTAPPFTLENEVYPSGT